MKKFKFSLQTVHNLRQEQRDKAERELARAATEVANAAAHLDEAVNNRAAAEQNYAAKLHSEDSLDPHEIALRADYLTLLTQRQRAASERLFTLEQERETRRRTAVMAARAAEATSKLRDRHRARHHLEAMRTEQNDLDEMATLLAARRAGSN